MLNTASMNSNAAECVRMAAEVDSSQQRTILLGLAQAWVALSDQAREIETQSARRQGSFADAPRYHVRDPEPAW